jgi:hypothetical protein
MGGTCSTFGDVKSHTKFYLETLKRRDQLGDPGIDGGIILTWTLMKYGVRV